MDADRVRGAIPSDVSFDSSKRDMNAALVAVRTVMPPTYARVSRPVPAIVAPLAVPIGGDRP
jgi:hypothetical protein